MKQEIKQRIKRDLLVLGVGAAIGVVGSKISVATHKGEESGVKIEIYQKTPKAPQVLEQEKLDKALFRATKKGDLDAVKQALENGANINATDSKGRTPVMIAARKSIKQMGDFKASKAFHEIAMYLISKNADLLVQDHEGATAAHYAAYDRDGGSLMNNKHRKLKDDADWKLRDTIEDVAKKQASRAKLLAGGGYTYQY
jgi:hypothetical protein